MHSLKDVHLSQPFQTHSLCTGKKIFRLSINKTAVSSEMSADCMAVLAQCDFGQHVFPNNKTSHKFCISLDSACASEEIF